MPLFREGGPAKWLINKDLQFHFRDFEPGGRRFESVRARFRIRKLRVVHCPEVSNILSNTFIQYRPRQHPSCQPPAELLFDGRGRATTVLTKVRAPCVNARGTKLRSSPCHGIATISYIVSKSESTIAMMAPARLSRRFWTGRFRRKPGAQAMRSSLQKAVISMVAGTCHSPSMCLTKACDGRSKRVIGSVMHRPWSVWPSSYLGSELAIPIGQHRRFLSGPT